MTNILLPDNDEKELKINYKPTETDEENFFLMYHLNFQPSEVENLNPDYKKWLIARLIMQKNMEQEALQRYKLMQQIGPNLKV